jgi:alkylation response protein AidB-like acyl-CoA dehydrogenase
MQFSPHADQQMVLDALRAVADGQLKPAAAQIDSQGQVPAAIVQHLRDLGAFGLLASEEAGGLGLDAVAAAQCWTLLGNAEAGTAQALAQHALALKALESCAAAGQLAKTIQALAAGKKRACFAAYDGDDHLDHAKLLACAGPREAGGWQVSGEKPWVLAAKGADVAVMLAATEAGPAWFLVELAGLTLGDVGEQLGLRGAAAAIIALPDVPALLLAEGAEAVALTGQLLAWAGLLTAAVAMGAGRAALEAASRYVQQREQFGKPIATLQPVQWHIANACTQLDAAQMLVMKAAWNLSRGAKGLEGGAWRLAKVRATEAAMQAADSAIQLHGGYGYTKDFPVERLYRDSQVLALINGGAAALKVQAARLLAA